MHNPVVDLAGKRLMQLLPCLTPVTAPNLRLLHRFLPIFATQKNGGLSMFGALDSALKSA